jgi:GTPase
MPHPQTETAVRRSGTAVMIGRTNVGKSTLLNAALREKLAIVTPTPQTTRDRILGVVRRADAQIALMDTPGMHKPHSHLGRRMNAIAREAVRGADVMIFVAAVPARSTGVLAPHPADQVLLQDLGRDIPSVLVLNKVDLLADKSRMLPLLDAYFRLREFDAAVPISALRDDGVTEVLDEVGKLLPERGPAYEDDFLTDRPLRFFASEYVREQVILATREEIPHGIAVTIERFDEGGPTVHIEATIHCSREGHRAIVIGKGGARLKAIGIAARQSIEAQLQRKVNLKLWVKVAEGWIDSPGSVVELGYDPQGPGEAP